MYFSESYLQKCEAEMPNATKDVPVHDSLETVYENFSKKASQGQFRYDIFLSHRFSDKNLIGRMAKVLAIKYKLRAYVDWIDDPDLDRGNVTYKTACLIKERLSQSKCLWYVTSSTTVNSKWMPWEVGVMDGMRGKVLICPFLESSSFEGLEYLSLYQQLYIGESSDKTKIDLAVKGLGKDPVWFTKWLTGQ